VVTRGFLPVAADNAVLIAVSTGGVSLVVPKTTAYLVSKFAAARLFEYVQAENPNIRVHNIHPGGIETQMVVKTKEAGMDFPLDDSK
jgi:NAD(P)-dependent dehydrogenase (short-subunit alcohol dehydrogenase family)